MADDAVDVFHVPGCFELPVAARRLIDGDEYDGIVALGVVVRGETPHFDYVAGECARGLMDVQVSTGVPVGFGVLTTDTLAQAERASRSEAGRQGLRRRHRGRDGGGDRAQSRPSARRLPLKPVRPVVKRTEPTVYSAYGGRPKNGRYVSSFRWRAGRTS